MVLGGGVTWWAARAACPAAASAVQLTPLPALRGRCRGPAQSQHIAPATLLLECCAAFDWNAWNTLSLEHCLSLEKAQRFPALSHPLLLVSAGQRQTCYCHYAMGTRPPGGEVAPQLLQVYTAPLQGDLATFPPVQ